MSKINWIKVSNEKGEQVGAISQEYWDYANKVIDEAFEEAIKELEKDFGKDFLGIAALKALEQPISTTQSEIDISELEPP